MESKVQDRIKELRKERKYTLEQLAGRAGCSKSYVSQLEKGINVPSMSMLEKLAGALDVKVVDLFAESNSEKKESLERTKMIEKRGTSIRNCFLSKEHRRTIRYPDGKTVDQLLTKGIFRKRMQPLISSIMPGGSLTDLEEAVHIEGTEEFLLILKGELDFKLESEEVKMREGDTLYFNGDTAHDWKNNGTEIAEVLFIWTPPIW